MHRSIIASVLLLGAVLASAGCGDDDTPPTTPTPPPQVSITFDGTLTPFSARIHDFPIQNPGTVDATLTTLTPADAVVGIDLGTWNGVSCQITVARASASQGDAVAATATTVARLCVRLWDPSETGLAAPVPYTITVRHF